MVRLLRGLLVVVLTSTTAAAQPAPPIVPIGAVHGVVSDSERGNAHQSPLKGQNVTVRGVVTELSLQRTSSGALNHGLFVQNALADVDGDPRTSDGIFVFIGSRSPSIGTYQPSVGDEIILSGRVDEFFNLTELISPRLVELVRQHVDLNAEVPAFEAQPPDDLADAQRYWERHESMRAHLPAGSIVVGARDVFGSTQDSEIWVIRPDSAVAQRTDPYARRVFRDAHPLDDHPETTFDNGNGFRILLGNSGVEATIGAGTLLPPARDFDTISTDLVGSVLYTFGKYRIDVTEQPTLAAGPDPSRLAPPAEIDRSQLYSVASFNLENLYDFRDDPFDNCDFVGNPGCPGVSPPFDYVPAGDAAYRARVAGLAAQIVDNLLSPDLVLVQEVEDQDICQLGDGDLVCGDEDNADGQPDTLQDLALAVLAHGGPSYAAALDRDGADDRGIVAGFLYRTDQVQLLPPSPADPLVGPRPQVSYRGDPLPYNTDVSNPKALNARLPSDIDRSTGTDGNNVFTRAPQVGLFRIWRDGIDVGGATDLYAISNHFSSGPDMRVGQRREQAVLAGALATALLTGQPGARVVIGGDLNVFPRPDDPFAPGDALFPSDQLRGLYEAGLTELWDRLVTDTLAGAYTYVFEGQAQTLDHLFVSPALVDDVDSIQVAHVNADFPAGDPNATLRGMSDHDPPRAVFRLRPGETIDAPPPNISHK
jgi:uncharacterized protein